MKSNFRQFVIYISGQYSADSQDGISANIQHAKEWAGKVWQSGFTALCPHLNTQHFESLCSLDYEDYIEGDKRLIDGCDALLMIPGWMESDGANEEKRYAESRGIKIFYDLDNLVKYFEVYSKKSVLERATLIVESRSILYGDPKKSWEEIAKISSILTNKELTNIDCVKILKVVKLVREKYKHKEDNLIDEAGYLAIEEMLNG